MISQPKLKEPHHPHEVWETRITVRSFVQHHRVAPDGEAALARVRFLSETATKPKTLN